MFQFIRCYRGDRGRSAHCELTDERRQRMATSEVLRLLSGSHGDLNHLFDTILANATNLCQANFGTLSLCEGDAFRIAALEGPLMAEHWRKGALHRPSPDVPLARIAQTGRPVHIADMREERAYLDGDPLPRIC